MSHPFEVLAGEWWGRGNGSYPTIADFSYSEHLAIEPVPGKPLARWTSKTRDAATGDARHAESGFLRATPSGVEFAVAHGFGVVEVATGSIDDASLLLSSDDLHGAPTAKQIDRVERRYDIDGDALQYSVAMAAVGVDITHHLRADLRRRTPIFHIARAEDWREAQAAGTYEQSTLGRTLAEEGFIHCSKAAQLAGVARASYAHETDLVLLEIDPGRLHAEVREENPPGSDVAFPHIYGPLNPDAVIHARPFDPYEEIDNAQHQH